MKDSLQRSKNKKYHDSLEMGDIKNFAYVIIVFTLILLKHDCKHIKLFLYVCKNGKLVIICDLPRENRPSSHLVMIVEIPVLKFLIGITSFCSC